MNSEIIKNKFDDESVWNQPGLAEGFDKFIKEKTSPIGKGNDPWNYNIPLNELNINITKVEQSVFEYNGRAFQCQTRKAPLLRICLLYTSPSPRDRQKSRMPSSA